MHNFSSRDPVVHVQERSSILAGTYVIIITSKNSENKICEIFYLDIVLRRKLELGTMKTLSQHT